MGKWTLLLLGVGWFSHSFYHTGKLSESSSWLKDLSFIHSQATVASQAAGREPLFWKSLNSEKYPGIVLAQEDMNSLKGEGHVIENTLKWALDKSQENLSAARQASGKEKNHQWVLPDNNPGKVSRPALEEALRNNPETAAYPLAYALEHGDGGESDYKRSLSLYKIASAHGDIRAQSRLGIAYMKGELGLEKDEDRAEKWLTEAAIHNDLSAQYYLGRLLLKDRDTDIVDALVWVAVAAKRGYEPAQYIVKDYWSKLKAGEQDELLSRVRRWRVNEASISVV